MTITSETILKLFSKVTTNTFTLHKVILQKDLLFTLVHESIFICLDEDRTTKSHFKEIPQSMIG